jgi:hypothetical protein
VILCGLEYYVIRLTYSYNSVGLFSDLVVDYKIMFVEYLPTRLQ